MPGLDRQILDQIDHNQLFNRIKIDVRSDFILAPHINAVFVSTPDLAWERVTELLRSGNYEPELPITMSVPKERGFVRPGSILLPLDRIVYQLLIDQASSMLEEQLDRERTFSHILADSDEHMFEPAHESWQNFQEKVLQMCRPNKYIVKADISNYFERIPQHHLINLMNSSGCSGAITNLMEELLLAFQERDSFGIIQGVFPSDVLGNFFLSDFDAYCELNDIDSARYVDDIFMEFDSSQDAQKGLINLIEHLCREGLHLNEFKSGIHPASDIRREETALDDLFEGARDEARDRLTDFPDIGYGFTAEWDIFEEPDEEEVELVATQLLYNAKNEFPEQAEKIERFSLPLMRATGSEYAINDVLNQLQSKPHLTRLYHSYLSKFVSENDEIVERLSQYIQANEFITDYQRMYIIGSLLNANNVSRRVVNVVLQWLQAPEIAKETRALAAIFTAKHGNPNQKRAVRLAYEGEPSTYVRAAILYSSKYFTTAEKRTCRRAWGGHNTLNSLITQTI